MLLKLFPHGCPSKGLKDSSVFCFTTGIKTFFPPSGTPASFTEISAHSGIQGTSSKLMPDYKFMVDNSTIQARNTQIQPLGKAKIVDDFSHLEAKENCAHLSGYKSSCQSLLPLLVPRASFYRFLFGFFWNKVFCLIWSNIDSIEDPHLNNHITIWTLQELERTEKSWIFRSFWTTERTYAL